MEASKNLRHKWWWGGLGWVLGGLAELGGGGRLEEMELITNEQNSEKKGNNCDMSGGQCKRWLELASSENLRHQRQWVGWVLGGLAELGGGDKRPRHKSVTPETQVSGTTMSHRPQNSKE